MDKGEMDTDQKLAAAVMANEKQIAILRDIQERLRVHRSKRPSRKPGRKMGRVR